MLICENVKTGEKYFPSNEKNSLEVDFNKDNLICPTCKEKVIFVNGNYKIEHFRHYIESECSTEPETIEHLNMKQFFIDKLGLTKDSVEVNLGFGKPDIFLKNRSIAIEVQHSPLSEEKFLERTANYTKNNIYVLWVFDSCLCKERISALLRKAHELYFGRVYFFVKGEIIPIHFKPVTRFIETQYIPEYIEDFEEYKNNGFEPYYKSVGGYEKTLKTKKELELGKAIPNVSQFIQTRNTWKNNNYLIAKFTDAKFWT
jgi:competence CoiA-like predicted nuclease